MEERPSFKFIQEYAPLFHSNKPYLMITSGRAAGKSTAAAAYAVIKLMEDSYNRIVISRYTAKSIKNSILRDILDLIKAWGLEGLVNIQGDQVTNRMNGNFIMTTAMRIADGAQVAQNKGISNCNILVIDEMQEIDKEEEWQKLIDSFRMKGVERKIIMLMNPTTTYSWIYKKFYVDEECLPNPIWQDDYDFLHLTYHCNRHNLDERKCEEWEKMQFQDPDYYRHHIMGYWQPGKIGRIFSNWSFDYNPLDYNSYDETIGLDFGFSADPTAAISVRKHNNKLWIKEIIYENGLTYDDLIKRLESLKISKSTRIIADSAEPRAIETILRAGYNIQAAYKGPDSIRNGINRLLSMQIIADPSSANLLEEYNLYSYDKNGNVGDQYNHLMDALRYSLSKDGGDGKYHWYGPSSSPKETDTDMRYINQTTNPAKMPMKKKQYW